MKPQCIWIYGEQKSGKTTIARLLKKKLEGMWILIDGDSFRKSRFTLLGYSKRDIIINNLECLNSVVMLLDNGYNVIVSMVTPLRDTRKEIMAALGDDVQMFQMSCPKEIREKRKGYYKADVPFEESDSQFRFHPISYQSFNTYLSKKNDIADVIINMVEEDLK